MDVERQGKNCRPLQPFRAGQVIWLPRGASWLNRDKARPFVLAAAPDIVRTGTLAYGSTAAAEQVLGAACSLVAPQRDGVNRNGLTAPTRFYPGVLLRRDAEALPAHAGTLGNSLDAFRLALRSALGIGQGSCLSAGAPPGSRRGRIVELERTLARDMRTRFAVLLTEAAYSRRDNYHLILPLMRGDGQSAAEDLLRLSHGSWISLFPTPTRSVLLPIPVVQSVWYSVDIERETEYVLDEDSLTEIDQRLCAYFSLPHHATEG